jgi:hypothetical protein
MRESGTRNRMANIGIQMYSGSFGLLRKYGCQAESDGQQRCEEKHDWEVKPAERKIDDRQILLFHEYVFW